MDDLSQAFDDRAQVILNRIDAKQWDLLVGVIESTDRVQHMMWRLIDPTHPMYDAALAAKFGDSIERVYRRADEFVGEVLRHIDADTTVLIVSDHGFHSWRKAVNLNTWLVQQGYMVLKGQQPATRRRSTTSSAAAQFWEERRLEPHARLRDGPRPDLLQPARARRAGHRQPGAGGDAAGRRAERRAC